MQFSFNVSIIRDSNCENRSMRIFFEFQITFEANFSFRIVTFDMKFIDLDPLFLYLSLFLSLSLPRNFSKNYFYRLRL